MEKAIFGTLQDKNEFREKASFLARLGSGSACRSVFGGFSLWGRTHAHEFSSDEVAISFNSNIHPVFDSYCDSIMVIHAGSKTVSSSAGHKLMEQNPFLTARIVQSHANLNEMLSILEKGDESGFDALVEEEALTLHAMMMVSRPGYLLLKPNSIEAIDRIIQFRADTRLPVCFTLDAGANVHILYPARILSQVRSFIASDLVTICEAGIIIHDEVGDGPVWLI